MKYIFEILDDVANAKTKEEKVKILQTNNCAALRDIIRGSMDKTIVWYLPKGPVPYESASERAPKNLRKENVKFTYFVKGGKADNINQIKRERIFLEIVEGIHPKDADYCVSMINKKTPKGLTRNIVNEAFPGLLRDNKK